MDNGKQFGQGAFSVISNHIYGLALINFYFVICNIVFLFFFLTLVPSFSNLVVYFIALIPTGPAISALFYTLGKLVREKEIAPTKDFFYSYKLNFVDSLKVWLPILLVLLILIVDVLYFNANPSTRNQILAGVFLVALILIGTITIYVFMISANFKFRVRDVYRLSMYYSLTRIKVTTGNIGILIVTLFLMFVISDFIILFIASLVCYTILLNSNPVMTDIKENFIKQDESSSDEIDDDK